MWARCSGKISSEVGKGKVAEDFKLPFARWEQVQLCIHQLCLWLHWSCLRGLAHRSLCPWTALPCSPLTPKLDGGTEQEGGNKSFLCVARSVLHSLHMWSDLALITFLWGKYHYPHFSKEGALFPEVDEPWEIRRLLPSPPPILVALYLMNYTIAMPTRFWFFRA